MSWVIEMLISALCQNNCGVILLADAHWDDNSLQCPKCGEDICFGECCVPENGVLISEYFRGVKNNG
jgi:hypothetical protein